MCGSIGEWFDMYVVLFVELLKLDGGVEPCLEVQVYFIDELFICEVVWIDVTTMLAVSLHNIIYKDEKHKSRSRMENCSANNIPQFLISSILY